MWIWLNNTLLKFETCFSRKAAFHWFIIVVLGIMLREDHLGVTSIIRSLQLSPDSYVAILHFFHATSWSLSGIRLTWLHILMQSGYVYYENDMPVLIGDGVKTGKEARKMPCVKRLHQESEDSSKAEYIFGHMFGALGILVGRAGRLFSLPLSMTIQDGNKVIGEWAGDEQSDESHVVRLIHEACTAAANMKKQCFLLLDRYFLTVPGLTMLREANKASGSTLLTIVTKAKMNAVAYEPPQPHAGRGRPAKKGDAVKLSELFASQEAAFMQTTLPLYGKLEAVRFLCKDLLWGKGLYQPLRFVLVVSGDLTAILVSTDLTLAPEAIIRLYSYRFKIETCFRAFKQLFAGFAYHFWSKSMPKLSRFAPTAALDEILNGITNAQVKANIAATYKAIHGFVMFACIAMGLTQLCAIRFHAVLIRTPLRWLRTPSAHGPSEATLISFLRKSFFCAFALFPHLPIMLFIRARMTASSIPLDSAAG